ncbi:MAG: hypothetical protein KAK00_07045 [Nanoarchaeota archaeon]|nr:hypothetical protein [Nanoarchaeota archaeon]
MGELSNSDNRYLYRAGQAIALYFLLQLAASCKTIGLPEESQLYAKSGIRHPHTLTYKGDRYNARDKVSQIEREDRNTPSEDPTMKHISGIYVLAQHLAEQAEKFTIDGILNSYVSKEGYEYGNSFVDVSIYGVKIELDKEEYWITAVDETEKEVKEFVTYDEDLGLAYLKTTHKTVSEEKFINISPLEALLKSEGGAVNIELFKQHEFTNDQEGLLAQIYAVLRDIRSGK